MASCKGGLRDLKHMKAVNIKEGQETVEGIKRCGALSNLADVSQSIHVSTLSHQSIRSPTT